jgi:hypothetical protein
MSELRLEKLGLRSTTWDAVTIDAEQMVDKHTVDQCRQRLADLAEQKEEAELCHNDDRVEQLHDEMDTIAAYLSNNTYQGESKPFPNDSSKIRTSVTKRIHDAINKIERHDDMLVRHLRYYIRTGNQCSYNPDPHNPITWSFL